MEKIAFIGGYDKTDIIIYISKILTVMGRKVLFIDTSLTQKAKYIVPTIIHEEKYVTTYDGIDVAINFEDINEVLEYMEIQDLSRYDYVIFDVDDPYYYFSFGLCSEDKHCLLTTFDVYSVEKGMEVLKEFKLPTRVQKILVTRNTNSNSEESKYLDFITSEFKIDWEKEIVFIPFDTEDLYEIYQNQRSEKVRFSRLSMEYMDGLTFLIEIITDLKRGEIKKAIKMIEKVN